MKLRTRAIIGPALGVLAWASAACVADGPHVWGGYTLSWQCKCSPTDIAAAAEHLVADAGCKSVSHTLLDHGVWHVVAELPTGHILRLEYAPISSDQVSFTILVSPSPDSRPSEEEPVAEKELAQSLFRAVVSFCDGGG